MTDKQIKQAYATIPQYPERNEEQQKLYDELSCRDMINSCLVYGESYNFYKPETGEFGMYAQRHIKTLGINTVIRLYNEQCEDFAKAIVKKNVHQDSEGVTYNSVIWEDEQ